MVISFKAVKLARDYERGLDELGRVDQVLVEKISRQPFL